MRRRKFIAMILLTLLLIGCKKENKNTGFKPKDKAPKSLKELSSGIDEILNSINDIEKISLNIPTKEQQEQQAGGQKNTSGAKDKNSGGQGRSGNAGGDGSNQNQQGSTGQSQSEGQQQKPPTKDEMIKGKWDSIQLKLEDVHSKWNAYEVEGLKKGLTKENGDKFEASINSMTKAIENKNILEVYNTASNSYLNLKSFYDLYKDEVSGDVYVIKYAANQAYLKAIEGDLEGAVNILNGREENINKIRLKQDKEEDKEKVEKISLSLADFRKALEEDSRHLFMIKRDVVVENLGDL